MPTMATQDEMEGIEHKEEQSKKEGQKKKRGYKARLQWLPEIRLRAREESIGYIPT